MQAELGFVVMSTMMFTTPEARASVLQGIRDGDDVELGSAMGHARATRLGPWDDRGMLKRDCATLLIGEIRRAGRVDGTLDEHAVITSQAFHVAFEHARYEIELKTERDLREALNQSPLHWDRPQGDPSPDDELSDGEVDAIARIFGDPTGGRR